MESKIVEATATAVMGKGRSLQTRNIEVAMREAIINAQSEGISDPAIIKQRIMDARDKVKTAMENREKSRPA